MDDPLRVAAYCRVSTDREDQAGSLRSQQTYFQEYIRRHPHWTLVEIYADEGISGTSTRHRAAFHRMVSDAQAGRMDLILTKEVSRFARNTVDALEYTRRLKACGVGVLFLNDNIDTRAGDGELRLTIMASIAQEESRKTSQRVKWGQKRRMEAGVVFGNDTIYGFHLHKGVLTVHPAQAAVVRRIYRKFLDEGKGAHVIARELGEEGVPPPLSPSGRWSPAMVRRVLTGEKYVGDVLCKKYITADYLTHQRVPNRGREEQVYLRDHHPAIIDRPTWEAVQAELARRGNQRRAQSRFSGRHWCSGKVRCGGCGGSFVPRVTHRPSGQVYIAWGCLRRLRQGAGDGGCDAGMVNQKVLDTCAQFVLRHLALDWAEITRRLAARLGQTARDTPKGDGAERLAVRRRQAEEQRAKALDAFLSGALTQGELETMRARYDQAIAQLDRRLAETRQVPQAELPADPAELARRAVEGADTSREVYRAVIQEVTVHPGYLDVKAAGVPGVFRLWYTTQGAGADYTAVIHAWERREDK